MDVTNETLENLERLAHYCQEIAEDDCSEKQCARALEPLNAACSPSTILSLCAEIKRLRAALEKIKDGGVPNGVTATVQERMLAMCDIAAEALAGKEQSK